MKRRDFLIAGTLMTHSVYLCAQPQMHLSFSNIPDVVWNTIDAVLAHMFPESGAIPSAKSMELMVFVRQTLVHQSYDKDIRRFVIQGAQKLHNQTNGEFAAMSSGSKEKVLRDYEKSTEGRQWLWRIMILGMEGLFGDPLYGSNIAKACWKVLGTSGGEPRPRTRYIAL